MHHNNTNRVNHGQGVVVTMATVQKNRNSTIHKQRQPRPGCGGNHARGGISRANHGQPVVKATAVVWYLNMKPNFQRQPRPDRGGGHGRGLESGQE